MVSDIVLSLVEVIYSVLPVTGITTVSTNNSCLPPANDLKELSTTLSILSMMLTCSIIAITGSTNSGCLSLVEDSSLW